MLGYDARVLLGGIFKHVSSSDSLPLCLPLFFLHALLTLTRGDDASNAAPLAMWLTPVRALVMFSLINLLTYLDRGAFAACLDTIEKDLALSNVDGGFIGSCVASAFVSVLALALHLNAFDWMFLWCFLHLCTSNLLCFARNTQDGS